MEPDKEDRPEGWVSRIFRYLVAVFGGILLLVIIVGASINKCSGG